jgi:hypothetical protein
MSRGNITHWGTRSWRIKIERCSATSARASTAVTLKPSARHETSRGGGIDPCAVSLEDLVDILRNKAPPSAAVRATAMLGAVRKLSVVNATALA